MRTSTVGSYAACCSASRTSTCFGCRTSACQVLTIRRSCKLAAEEGRVLFTHDRKTVPRHAWERVEAGLLMSGVFIASAELPIQQVIEDILLLAECSRDGEWDRQVRYLPL